MNCSKIELLTRWTCAPSGIGSVRAVSPIPMADGGQIAFYIAQPTESTFYLTDACETAIYADQLGLGLNKKKLETLNRTPGIALAQFDLNDWSIEATGQIGDLPAALWDSVKLALAMSFKSEAWRPKFDQAKFQALVINELEAQLGADRVIRQVRVQGASGHTIEFPVGIRSQESGLIYVQPVALDDTKVNWPSIYEFHGKLFDVKLASEIDNRLAIIETGAAELEFGRAANFLANAANVLTLNDIAGLAKNYALA